LGQNFILDKNFTDKIVRLAGDTANKNILEIGPGPGSLTRSILDTKPQKLIAIERDERCIKALSELQNHYGEVLKIINNDALEVNELEFFNNEKFLIIANLPYNIGTVLLFKWLKIYQQISAMYLMLQFEVAQRITAKVGDKHYGRLAIMVNLLCETKIAMKVQNTVFSPPPKVQSAIVEIIPREKPLCDVDINKLSTIVAIAFNQRRKMIKSTLKAAFRNVEDVLNRCDINPNLRAENLTIEDFCKLANLYKCDE